MSEDYLQDLLGVGQDKPMGYLPLMTIARAGSTPEKMITWAETNGLKHKMMTEHQCSVASGALYIWCPKSVQDILSANTIILKTHKWPVRAQAFVQAVATRLAPDGPVYELVGVMFSDTRMSEPKWVRRPTKNKAPKMG